MNDLQDQKFLLSSYNYHLPPELIAQEPADPRDSSRLMVCDTPTGSIDHRVFRDIEQILDPHDILVLNDSRVIPARVRGRKLTGGKAEVLFLNPGSDPKSDGPLEALIKGKVREGSVIIPKKPPLPHHAEGNIGNGFAGSEGENLHQARIRILRHINEGRFEVEIEGLEDETDILNFMDQHGEMPVPPYIRKSLHRRENYQTVYSRSPGSIAAPTAGLHFTPELLHRLERKGIRIVTITLHVSIGTFLPVRHNDIRKHTMEPEYFILNDPAAEMLGSGEEVTAVGTTVVKTLESAFHMRSSGSAGGGRTAAKENGALRTEGWSDLFIYPGHRFLSPLKGMLTNFHLPASTLIMLVSAYAGRKNILRSYEEAVRERYRFYSFGDAMFLKGKPIQM